MPDWPHAPIHRLEHGGAFMVTCGTYRKEHFFREPGRLTLLQDTLFSLADELNWRLQAWAIFSNHYHFVAMSPEDASSLKTLIKRLHGSTAVAVNRIDSVSGRKVWYQYFEKHLTYEDAYLPRLKYVHNNPVHHGIVPVADQYAWCSAAWFGRTADNAFIRTVNSFKTDRLNVGPEY